MEAARHERVALTRNGQPAACLINVAGLHAAQEAPSEWEAEEEGAMGERGREQDVRLSKRMSLLLRHRPEAGGLVLDGEGMAPLAALLRAVRAGRGFEWVTEADLRRVVATSDKQRFRIEGERIGARYGHNRRVPPVAVGEPVAPPETLYHGTPREAVAQILAEGLKPQGRQFVHLSRTPGTALSVGARRDAQPALLRIAARRAHADGLPFFAPTPETFLASHVPPGYIEVESGEWGVESGTAARS